MRAPSSRIATLPIVRAAASEARLLRHRTWEAVSRIAQCATREMSVPVAASRWLIASQRTSTTGTFALSLATYPSEIHEPPFAHHSTISNGKSIDNGGAIYITDAASPRFSLVTVSDNDCISSGGALVAISQCSPTFVDVVFQRNSAASFGGGSYGVCCWVDPCKCTDMCGGSSSTHYQHCIWEERRTSRLCDARCSRTRLRTTLAPCG